MIKGLSEIRRLPRIGKIHLGVKDETKEGTKYPRIADHFVVKEDESTPKASVEAFRAVYGDHPKEINIIFPSDDTEKIFPQWLKRYGKNRKWLCRGDGETAQQVDTQTGELKEITCLYMECPHYQKRYCRQEGNLKFIIKEIPGGVWQIDTKSYYSIVNINSAIDAIKLANGGHIAGIPLKLTINPMEVTIDGKLKTIYVLNLYQTNQSINKTELKTKSNAADNKAKFPDIEELFDVYFPDSESEPVLNSEEQTENNITPPVEQAKEMQTKNDETTEQDTEPAQNEPDLSNMLVVCNILDEIRGKKKFVKVIACDGNGDNEAEYYPKEPAEIVRAGAGCILYDVKVVKNGNFNVIESYKIMDQQKQAM